MNELLCGQNNQYYYTYTKHLVSPFTSRDNFHIQKYHEYTIHLHKNVIMVIWKLYFLSQFWSSILRLRYNLTKYTPSADYVIQNKKWNR